MAKILSVWAEIPDKVDADAIAAKVRDLIGVPEAIITVQEHIPHSPTDAVAEAPVTTEEDPDV